MHPYAAPEIDNGELEFTTLLKKPIIIKDNGTLNFAEVVLVEPGGLTSVYGDSDFYDYVIVEGSKNNGANCIPFPMVTIRRTSLYGKRITIVEYQLMDKTRRPKVRPTGFVNRSITLTDNDYFVAGDTILIRFRLYSDPYATGLGLGN